MAKSLMELIVEYGKHRESQGYDCAEAQSFEGDSLARECRRNEAKSKRAAEQALLKIKKLLGT